MVHHSVHSVSDRTCNPNRLELIFENILRDIRFHNGLVHYSGLRNANTLSRSFLSFPTRCTMSIPASPPNIAHGKTSTADPFWYWSQTAQSKRLHKQMYGGHTDTHKGATLLLPNLNHFGQRLDKELREQIGSWLVGHQRGITHSRLVAPIKQDDLYQSKDMPAVWGILSRTHYFVNLVVPEILIEAHWFMAFGYGLPKSHRFALIPEITEGMNIPKYMMEEYSVSHPIRNRCHVLQMHMVKTLN